MTSMLHVTSVMHDIIAANIERTGQHLFGVFPTEESPGPSFVYSIGNALKGLPEFLVIGNFNPNEIGRVVNFLCDMQREEGKALEGDVSLGGKFPMRMHRASDLAKSEYTVQAGEFFGRQDYDVTQILICDLEGNYPGSPNCEERFNMPII